MKKYRIFLTFYFAMIALPALAGMRAVCGEKPAVCCSSAVSGGEQNQYFMLGGQCKPAKTPGVDITSARPIDVSNCIKSEALVYNADGTPATGLLGSSCEAK